MVLGWPGRAGRGSYGPTMRDERRTVNTEEEFNASQVNLAEWQLGAMGLIAPKAVIFVRTVDEFVFQYGLFSWDQTIYTPASPPAFVTLDRVSQGIYTVAFPTEVLGRPDGDGIQQLEPLAFQFGMSSVNATNSQRLFSEITLTDPQTFAIDTRRAAGVIDANFALAGW